MIIAVEFQGQLFRTDRYSGKLPVACNHGTFQAVTWGNWDKQSSDIYPRKNDVPLHKVKEGLWEQLNSRPVKVLANRYLLGSGRGSDEQWFDVPMGKCIQGMVVDWVGYTGTTPLVFVVTVSRGPYELHPFYRVPRLIPHAHGRSIADARASC